MGALGFVQCARPCLVTTRYLGHLGSWEIRMQQSACGVILPVLPLQPRPAVSNQGDRDPQKNLLSCDPAWQAIGRSCADFQVRKTGWQPR